MPQMLASEAMLPYSNRYNVRTHDLNYRYSTNVHTHQRELISALRKIEEHRLVRYTNFPSLKGGNDFDFSKIYVKVRKDLTKSNSEADWPTAPDYTRPTDNEEKCHAHTQVQHWKQLSAALKPLAENTQSVLTAPPELHCLGTWCPGAPTLWNSRKTSDEWIRSKIGDCTNNAVPRETNDLDQRPKTSQTRGQISNTQNQLALKYMYGTSTQSGYEDVPWDDLLRPKPWPPSLSMLDKPDISLYKKNISSSQQRYNQPAQELQGTGIGCECNVPEQKYNKEGPLIRPDLRSQMQQDPLYRPVVLERFSTYPTFDYIRKSDTQKKVTFAPLYSQFNGEEKVHGHF